MSQRHLIYRFLPAAFFLLIMSQPLEVGAQAGCFGELFPVGALAGSGNCDGIRAGQAVALINNPAHAAWGESLVGRWRVSAVVWTRCSATCLERGQVSA